jgi:hypothetical protein
MAPAITCDMCQQEIASVMQTNIGNGDVVAVGNSCLLTFYITIVAEVVDAMDPDLRLAYAEVISPVVVKLVEAMAAAGVAPAMDENPAAGNMEMLPMSEESAISIHGDTDSEREERGLFHGTGEEGE